jgi:hypothetical protein
LRTLHDGSTAVGQTSQIRNARDAHAARNRIERGAHFGNHSTFDHLCFDERFGLRGSERWNHAILLHHAGDVGDKDDCLGVQRAGNRAGDRIRVHIVRAIVSQRNRRDDRNDVAGEQIVQDLATHADHFAHASQIARRMLHLFDAHERAIHPAQTNRVCARRDECSNDTFVHATTEHHLGDSERSLIGHAQAIHKARDQAKVQLQFGDFLAATMHNHRRLAHLRHCARQSKQKLVIINFIATDFEYEHCFSSSLLRIFTSTPASLPGQTSRSYFARLVHSRL